MLQAILDLLPEWTLPVLFGAAAWFGLNYIYLTGIIMERRADLQCHPTQRSFCFCEEAVLMADTRLEHAIWTSTLGLYDITYSPDVIAARKRAEGLCG